MEGPSDEAVEITALPTISRPSQQQRGSSLRRMMARARSGLSSSNERSYRSLTEEPCISAAVSRPSEETARKRPARQISSSRRTISRRSNSSSTSAAHAGPLSLALNNDEQDEEEDLEVQSVRSEISPTRERNTQPRKVAAEVARRSSTLSSSLNFAEPYVRREGKRNSIRDEIAQERNRAIPRIRDFARQRQRQRIMNQYERADPAPLRLSSKSHLTGGQQTDETMRPGAFHSSLPPNSSSRRVLAHTHSEARDLGLLEEAPSVSTLDIQTLPMETTEWGHDNSVPSLMVPGDEDPNASALWSQGSESSLPMEAVVSRIGEDQESTKPTKDRRHFVAVAGVFVVVIAMIMIGVGVTLGVMNKSDAKAHDEESTLKPEVSLTPACSAKVVFDSCPDGVDHFRLEDVPPCLLSSYEIAREEFMPQIDPRFDSKFTSCDSRNLAVWTLASALSLNVTSFAEIDVRLSAFQRYALGTLHIEVGGSVDQPKDWLGPLNECLWTGVQCNPETGDIVLLRMQPSGREGTIPSQLGLLASLKWLDLSYSLWTGDIPIELGNLKRLETFTVSGSILLKPFTFPTWILNLSNLKHLSIGSVPMDGPIPTEIGRLSRLEELTIHETHLLQLPTEIGLLTTLKSVHMKSNELAGTLLSELGQLTMLTRLSVENNYLSGDLPSELGRLTNLEALLFGSNRFEGVIPMEVCDLWKWSLLSLGAESTECYQHDFPYGGLACPSDTCCPSCPIDTRNGNLYGQG